MVQKVKQLFPLGIATGAAHCNRVTERETLKQNVRSNQHTWLWARRRTGKTSLIEQVLGELKRGRPSIPSVSLDLNLVHDAESLEATVRRAAATLAIALVPAKQKPQRVLQRVFDRFRPEFTVGAPGFKMTLRAPEVPAEGIADVLLALDAAATVAKRKAVFVFDEFQQLSSLNYGQTDVTLEGAIRHAVERSKNVAYVFSGSQRSLLADMFENPDRPLYRHCRKMELGRILAADYEKYLHKAAEARWDEILEDEVLQTILALTRRHPYYVNALCAELWRADTPPTLRALNDAWQMLVEQDTAIVAQYVRTLSATQRAMLVGIAMADRIEHPTGRAFLARLRLSASTGSVAKRILEDEDLIRETEDHHWELVDPVMAAYVRSSRI